MSGVGTETAADVLEVGMRAGEVKVALPQAFDAGVYFIGRIRTPWTRRSDCPRRGDPVAGPVCRLEIDLRWAQALEGLVDTPRLQVLYWMHEARRDLVLQSPGHRGKLAGTFSLRSPVRPNPIASSVVERVGVEGTHVLVRGLDCLDGTPLLDLKPDVCAHASA
ncbi:SAM-dependent methyltransferase [Aquabacter sp. L1I39]|uniref:SAM-dependent methyltransferase n=1 Tax=Aquabacter sp. L1I39 TaxID=2820278 RepID=UPI001AD9726E|nr:SAM-dependent methyltransferase [Aquabacter sp. L1I39]QTL01618.1 SAM-dependent methyltransferase [Aquabacter sp. L1I39]